MKLKTLLGGVAALTLTACYDPFEQQTYIDDNAEEMEAFAHQPITDEGIPYLLFKILPQGFPDIYGPDLTASIGLTQVAGEPLPVGIGRIQSVSAPFQSIATNCAACHEGKILNDDGSITRIIGAPNMQFSPNVYRRKLVDLVNSPNWNAEYLVNLINSQPPGFFGFDTIEEEFRERAIVTAALPYLVEPLRQGIMFVDSRYTSLEPFYEVRDGVNYMEMPHYGATDQGVEFAALFGEDAIPVPSAFQPVWNVGRKELTQWGGESQSNLSRNISTGIYFSTVQPGDDDRARPYIVDYAKTVTAFVRDLPSPQYQTSYDVDWRKAKKGKHLYEQYCAGCHATENLTIYTPDSLGGVDPNRALSYTQNFLEVNGREGRAACEKFGIEECSTAGSPRSATDGYLADDLNGIVWTAPYLHNNSVPTLRDLFRKGEDRPVEFCVGGMRFNHDDVGYTGQCLELYETNRPGHSNGGHDTYAVMGPLMYSGDYANDAQDPAHRKISAVIEYMKVLRYTQDEEGNGRMFPSYADIAYGILND
ncbi:Uncharacterised protein [BD1-7 clade bacterium]|uniref:Cytochrome c domain-containing protein n=1 Tax=BD1-7 clade bacterium TaxID=2029982 RepID=A0A5S9N5G3_9GAMM|nr:Uncharacterised protein [BD1-7 clade bacterium]CAA0085073.1 Uncharacterised protein [BD1-7 clade bacterium]